MDVGQPGAVAAAHVGDEVGLVLDRIAVEDVEEYVVGVGKVAPMCGGAGQDIQAPVHPLLAQSSLAEQKVGKLQEHRRVGAHHAVQQCMGEGRPPVGGPRRCTRIDPTQVTEEAQDIGLQIVGPWRRTRGVLPPKGQHERHGEQAIQVAPGLFVGLARAGR